MSSIDDAFRIVDRRNFVLPEYRHRAGEDRPLPIGFGQTISQPTTVKNMLSWLNVESGQNILDVGSGSGWTSALLAELSKPDGHITAVERITELVTFGRNNVQRANIKNIEFHQASNTYGWAANAPYDRILVSASADELPLALIDQLKPGGKLVIPIRNTIHEITKRPSGEFDDRPHFGYVFVPLLPGIE